MIFVNTVYLNQQVPICLKQVFTFSLNVALDMHSFWLRILRK